MNTANYSISSLKKCGVMPYSDEATLIYDAISLTKQQWI